MLPRGKCEELAAEVVLLDSSPRAKEQVRRDRGVRILCTTTSHEFTATDMRDRTHMSVTKKDNAGNWELRGKLGRRERGDDVQNP